MLRLYIYVYILYKAIYMYIYYIYIYLSCLEERLLDSEIPSKRLNNLTKEEWEALYSLKDDRSIIINGAGKGLGQRGLLEGGI